MALIERRRRKILSILTKEELDHIMGVDKRPWLMSREAIIEYLMSEFDTYRKDIRFECEEILEAFI